MKTEMSYIIDMLELGLYNTSLVAKMSPSAEEDYKKIQECINDLKSIDAKSKSEIYYKQLNDISCNILDAVYYHTLSYYTLASFIPQQFKEIIANHLYEKFKYMNPKKLMDLMDKYDIGDLAIIILNYKNCRYESD